jgi:rhodanese-related sulfurtransferase
MAKAHGAGFTRLVDEARRQIRECTVHDVKQRLDRGERFLLLDVREESEFAADHLPTAIHLGRGILERDIEEKVPDRTHELVLYCGGGFRSALAAESLKKMGYTNVISMDGGIRGWRDARYPVTKT